MSQSDSIELTNEYASVKITVEKIDNQTYLKVKDNLRDRAFTLSPEEVQSLTKLSTGDLDDLLPY